VNSETDFVSRNEQFQDFVRGVASLALAADGDMDKLLAADYPGAGRTVADQLTHMIATIGENMTIRRCDVMTVGNGVLSTYVHNAMTDGVGKIAVLVGLESTGDKGKLEAFGKQLAMHVAAAKPQSVWRHFDQWFQDVRSWRRHRERSRRFRRRGRGRGRILILRRGVPAAFPGAGQDAVRRVM
jgi:translation elongation factor EF-Ts